MFHTNPVVDALAERRRADYVPGQSAPDGRRIALLVQGGGMRGVISGAMVAALDDLGYGHVFDLVVGTSAGAMNGAYFLAGETWYTLSIYWDNLATRRFVDFSRPVRRRPILDLDYGIDTITEIDKPLNHKAVLASATEFIVYVTNVDAMRAESVSRFRSWPHLKEALRATCWLPIASHGTARLDGYRAIDGGVLLPHLLTAALADPDITHVLSLRTLSDRPQPRRLLSHLPRLYLNHMRPGLGDAYVAAVADTPQIPSTGGPFVLEICPAYDRLERHETRPYPVMTAARLAYAQLLWTFGINADPTRGVVFRLTQAPRARRHPIPRAKQ